LTTLSKDDQVDVSLFLVHDQG